MHLPDGYLNDPVCAATGLLAAGSLAAAAMGLRRSGGAAKTETFAATSAAIFTAQMINVQLLHDTSGHLLGAALAALLLGPATAMVAMTVVLLAQATLFGDGGLAALGANVLNMAVVAPLAATLLDQVLSGFVTNRMLRAGLAAFGSVLAAALLCSAELAVAGTAPAVDVLPLMLRTHLAIGLAEGLLTAALVGLAVVAQARFQTATSTGAQPKLSVQASMLLATALVVAGCLAPWASTLPDGLESVAEHLGFQGLASTGVAYLAPDYTLPRAYGLPFSMALAGILGVLAVASASFVLGHAAQKAQSARVQVGQR